MSQRHHHHEDRRQREGEEGGGDGCHDAPPAGLLAGILRRHLGLRWQRRGLRRAAAHAGAAALGQLERVAARAARTLTLRRGGVVPAQALRRARRHATRSGAQRAHRHHQVIAGGARHTHRVRRTERVVARRTARKGDIDRGAGRVSREAIAVAVVYAHRHGTGGARGGGRPSDGRSSPWCRAPRLLPPCLHSFSIAQRTLTNNITGVTTATM